MVKWVFLFLISGFIVLGTTLYFNLGAYKEVTLTETQRAEFHILYKKHTGAYHKIAPLIIEVEKWASQNNVNCARTFGLYFDSPSVVDEDRLRSHAGCVVTGPVDGMPEGYEYRKVPAMNILLATFGGAPSISPFVVYPKVDEWLAHQGKRVKGPVFEIYDIQGSKSAMTEYLFPL